MMNMLRSGLLIAVTLLLTISILEAQEVDHVYLKSGSVIRGNIMEIDPVDHVKIQDLCGNIWYYQIATVNSLDSRRVLSI